MKKIFTLLTIAVSFAAFAQDEEKTLSISGTVDAYYQSNLSAGDDVAQSFGTSFADETGFALGMANLIASYEGEKTSCNLSIVW